MNLLYNMSDFEENADFIESNNNNAQIQLEGLLNTLDPMDTFEIRVTCPNTAYN